MVKHNNFLIIIIIKDLLNIILKALLIKSKVSLDIVKKTCLFFTLTQLMPLTDIRNIS